jgi:hypothetical protein
MVGMRELMWSALKVMLMVVSWESMTDWAMEAL